MNRETLRESASVAGVAALVILAIPLLFLVAFLYRAALFAGVAVGLVGIVVAVFLSANVRGRFRSMIEPEVEYKGIRLSTEVFLGPGHSWARVSRDGAFVGIDDLAARCIGPADRIELPPPGLDVTQGDSLFAIGSGKRRLETRSPLDGTVVAANEALHRNPRRINEDPYGLGWVVRIRSDSPSREKRRLRHGRDAERWFRDEIDKLVAMVGRSENAAPSLPDGGVIADGLERLIDEPTWQRLRSDLFEPDRHSGMEVES